MGQFICINPNINTTTQQLDGCQPNNVAKVRCLVAPDIHCDGLGVNRTFWKEVPCKYTNGYSYDVSLILSILLGMFGADRFYLGYPGIGLLKLCTLGGFFLFQLVDIVLIVSGNLGPADGSNFIIPFYGQGSQRMAFTANRTYLKPPPPEL
ncbi:putative TM2 domain-containing protein [Hypsibius exemplaris]|uniref:TM2 domain-containing protein n=1 Tax=Hypsibius exemplaris TaxID=2072580 RepID=A0A1W0X0Q3_HYPEX|nr:putative TM2 domain-containing protein [Hypsibius exemplaris]